MRGVRIIPPAYLASDHFFASFASIACVHASHSVNEKALAFVASDATFRNGTGAESKNCGEFARFLSNSLYRRQGGNNVEA